MARIIVEGSSTAYGLWSGDQGGWVDNLRMNYTNTPDRRSFTAVINLAVPSKTIEESIVTFDATAQTQARFSPVRLALFQLGMLESRTVDGKPEMQPERFEELVRRLGTISLTHGFSPLFVGMTPIDEGRTKHIVAKGQVFSYTDESRQLYDGVVRSYADEHGHEYVELTEKIAAINPSIYELLDGDGLHLNGQGHAIVSTIVKPYVDDALRRQRDYQTSTATYVAG